MQCSEEMTADVDLFTWAQPLRGPDLPPAKKLDGPPTFYVAFWWGSGEGKRRRQVSK